MEKFELAKNLLSDDFFIGELENMKQTELLNIVNSAPEDNEARELAYLKIHALQSIKGHFESIAATGQIVKKRWKIL
jgi:hypothetical protein